MRLDETGIKFLKDREGLRLSAYLDTAGIPTIGYGTTVYPSGKKVKIGDTCTLEQAEYYKTHDLIKFEETVNRYITNIFEAAPDKELLYPPLTQNQYNALVALCYNIGVNGFIGNPVSTIRKYVNSPLRTDKEAIRTAFLAWNKITVIKDGKKVKEVSPGLVNRRKKEIELYFS